MLVLAYKMSKDNQSDLKKRKDAKVFVGHEAYLQEFEIDGEKFLGKALDEPANISDLVLSQAHVESLIKRLFPGKESQKLQVLSFTND